MHDWIPQHGPEETLYKLAHKANEAERESTKLEEQFRILDDVKKEMFAAIVEKQSGKTTAEKERSALTSNEWGEWMLGWANARNAALIAKVERNIAVRNWETCRSIMSSLRTERATNT